MERLVHENVPPAALEDPAHRFWLTTKGNLGRAERAPFQVTCSERHDPASLSLAGQPCLGGPLRQVPSDCLQVGAGGPLPFRLSRAPPVAPSPSDLLEHEQQRALASPEDRLVSGAALEEAHLTRLHPDRSVVVAQPERELALEHVERVRARAPLPLLEPLRELEQPELPSPPVGTS